MRPAPTTAFIALLLALPLLAGCFQPDTPPQTPTPSPGPVRNPHDVEPMLSTPRFTEVVKEHILVPSFDGKRMDNWVFRPKTPAGERVPVVINFSPYWGNLAPRAEDEGDHFSQHLTGYFLPRGYAIVLSSVRGTGDSEGCFNLGGDIEKRDAVAVIEHFAKQAWSNGNIAAAGKSYDGTTPQGVATLHPPALKALIPVSPISELYKYNYKAGIAYGGLHGATFNARYPTTVGWTEGVPSPDDVACADYPVIAGTGLLTAGTGDYTEYWQERDYAATADQATAALFYIHGLQDWNVKPDHALPWLERYAGPKKVWLHQWETQNDGGHVYPLRQDWNYTMLRFLDHTLKGVDTGLFQEPSVQVEDTSGRWRHEATWPPATATPMRLWLNSDGEGVLTPGQGSPKERSFVDDGKVPTAAGSTVNQLVYKSEPIAADSHLTGVPRLSLTVSSDKPLGKIGAVLWAVRDEGEPTVITWGGLNLRHREDVRAPQDVRPDEKYEIELEFFPQDTFVRVGSRLVLALAGNAGIGSAGYLRFEEVNTQARITVVEGKDAFLDFPVQTTASLTYEDPQPAEASGCWAC